MNKIILLGSIALVIIGIALFIQNQKNIPTDLSSWQTIDTNIEATDSIFTLVNVPNPHFSLQVPPEYKWKYTVTKKDSACNAENVCKEESSVVLEIRNFIPGIATKYSEGYLIKIEKTEESLDAFIASLYASLQKKGKKVSAPQKEYVSGQETYLIVWDRTEAEAQKHYIYYTIRNGALISISSYNKPSPDFLSTIVWK